MMTLANTTSGYALGNGGLAFIGVYILTLIGIGWLGHRAKKEEPPIWAHRATAAWLGVIMTPPSCTVI